MDSNEYVAVCLGAFMVGAMALSLGVTLLVENVKRWPWVLVLGGALFVVPVLVKLWLAVVLG